MHPMLNIAVRAARAGGDFIARYIDRIDSLSVTEKSRNDFVSEVDKGAEKTIIDVIRKAYPEHSILAKKRVVMRAMSTSGLLTHSTGLLISSVEFLTMRCL